MSPSAKFRARLFIGEGGITELQVWDDDLTPLDRTTRPIREWVEEHFQGCYGEEGIRDMFELPKEGEFEVVMEGQINGTFCHVTGEYDEDVDVIKCDKQAMPYNPEDDEPIIVE